MFVQLGEACAVKTGQMNYGWTKAFNAGLLQMFEIIILIGVISEAEIKDEKYLLLK